MRKCFSAIAVSTLFCFVNAAFANEVTWQGELVLTSATASCTIPSGTRFNVKFEPAGLADNGPVSAVATYGRASAIHLRKTGSISSTYSTMDVVHLGVSFSTYKASMRFSSQNPATITATTRFINIQGSVVGFNGEPSGCTQNFNMTLSPNN